MVSTSSTSTIELQHIELPAQPAPAQQPSHSIKDESPGANRLLGELGGSEFCPSPAIPAVEKWNEPRRNSYRLGAAFWCFLVMGANDAAYGVCCRCRCSCHLC